MLPGHGKSPMPWNEGGGGGGGGWGKGELVIKVRNDLIPLHYIN